MLQQPKVVIAGLEAVASGTAIAYQGQSVEITPLPATQPNLKYEIVVRVDAAQPTSIKNVGVTPMHARVEVSVDKLADISTSAPMEVGFVGTQKLYISFAVSFVGDALKHTLCVSYTFLISAP